MEEGEKKNEKLRSSTSTTGVIGHFQWSSVFQVRSQKSEMVEGPSYLHK